MHKIERTGNLLNLIFIYIILEKKTGVKLN